jgi:hypothetical protein
MPTECVWQNAKEPALQVISSSDKFGMVTALNVGNDGLVGGVGLNIYRFKGSVLVTSSGPFGCHGYPLVTTIGLY